MWMIMAENGCLVLKPASSVNIRSNTDPANHRGATSLAMSCDPHYAESWWPSAEDKMAEIWCIFLPCSIEYCIFIRYIWPITKLTISRQFRRDTESCYLFFSLKLLIFDSENECKVASKNNENTAVCGL